MVNQALIQKKVAAGYAKAALRLGAMVSQYRPASLTEPLAAAIATPMADFSNNPAFAFRSPPLWDKPVTWALVDTTDVLAGDIFVAPIGTYFVARVEPYRPPVCMLTNRTVTLSGDAGAGSTIGEGTTCSMAGYDNAEYGPSPVYGGTALASGWPAFITLKNKGQVPETGIPGDLRAGEFEMFLPVMPDFVPAVAMTAVTDLGTPYRLTAVEPSPYGTRCQMEVVQI